MAAQVPMTFVAMQRAALLCSELPEHTEGYHCWQMTTPVPAASGLLIGAYASREHIVTPDIPVVFFAHPKPNCCRATTIPASSVWWARTDRLVPRPVRPLSHWKKLKLAKRRPAFPTSSPLHLHYAQHCTHHREAGPAHCLSPLSITSVCTHRWCGFTSSLCQRKQVLAGDGQCRHSDQAGAAGLFRQDGWAAK